MVNSQVLSGTWNDIKGQLRKKWGQLTNDDVQSFDGNVDRLVGMIQTKTGEARNSVENFLEELTRSGSSSIGQTAENVGNYVSGAASRARDYAGRAANQAYDYANQAASTIGQESQMAYDSLQEGYRSAETAIRSRPTEAAAFCFFAGVLSGLLISAMMSSNQR